MRSKPQAIRRSVFALWVGLSSLILFGCAAEERAPNIVLLIGDDHGYPYFGFMNHPIAKTPHLDRLANEGVVFTRGFDTASTCRPALMTLLTGLHPEQWDAERARLATDSRVEKGVHMIRSFDTVPRALAERGYVSFQGGKFWEGSYLDAGFSAGTKLPASPDAPKASVAGGMHQVAGGDGLTLGRETMQPLWDFFDGLDESRPFFVWYAPLLPHGPFDPPAEFTRGYKGRRLTPQATKYYGNITRFDSGVGEIMQQLEDRGLSENTLVIYLSDNGWQQPPYEATAFNGGDRGKNSIYEIGFRTPILFHWPGRIEPRATRRDLVSTVDIASTILDYAGSRGLPGRDGISLRSTVEAGRAHPRSAVIAGMNRLRKPAGTGKRGDVASWSSSRVAYVLRNEEWRYIWYPETDDHELYRIEEDPTEQRNLVNANDALAQQFRAEILDWRTRMRAELR